MSLINPTLLSIYHPCARILFSAGERTHEGARAPLQHPLPQPVGNVSGVVKCGTPGCVVRIQNEGWGFERAVPAMVSGGPSDEAGDMD
jgi:hypothetical protein